MKQGAPIYGAPFRFRMKISATKTKALESVLHLDEKWVEWLGHRKDGSPGYARVAIEGPGLDGIVKAAVEAVRASGAPGRACTVALGRGLLHQERLELPDLDKPSLKAVLERKASKLIDGDEKSPLFASLAFPATDEEETVGKRLLVVLGRDEIRELLRRLKSQGIQARHLVAAEFERLSASYRVADHEEDAYIFVDVGLESCLITLVANKVIGHQTRLAGSLEEDQGRVLTLIQELRSLDFHWRKLSRGGTIRQVVLVGLNKQKARLFEAALKNAMGAVELVVLDYWGEQEDQHSQSGRLSALNAGTTKGEFSLDFSPLLPKSLVPLVMASAALLLMTAIGLLEIHDWLSREIRETNSKTSQITAQAVDLQALRGQHKAADKGIKELHSELNRLQKTANVGIRLQACLEDTLRAFSENGALLTFSIEKNFDGTKARFIGETSAHPLKAYQSLEALRAKLEASDQFKGVEIVPIGKQPGEERSTIKTSSFRVTARMEDAY